MGTLSLNAHAKKPKTVLVTVALLWQFFAVPFLAHAEVIIIKDAEIKPYREAIEGFKSTCGCRVRELELSDSRLFEKIRTAQPDAVFAVGTRTFKKAREIKDVPAIYTMVIPSEAAEPSADNVSGVSMDIDPEAHLSAIVRLFPGIKKIGIISDPEHTGAFVNEAAAVARKRGITLIVKTISSPRQAPALLNELLNKIDLFWMLPDSTFVNSETVDYLMLFSFQNKIPVFSFSNKYVETGAAAALAINPYEMGAQSGELARLVSRGEKVPKRLYARNPRLIVNRKVISKIGVRISDEILRNAEHVE
jgi:putative ABC transport system substrate-binding protein